MSRECCVCMELLNSNVTIFPCSHQIHADCFNLMLKNSKTHELICPLCRTPYEQFPVEEVIKRPKKKIRYYSVKYLHDRLLF
jgi:hypothetical protein